MLAYFFPKKFLFPSLFLQQNLPYWQMVMVDWWMMPVCNSLFQVVFEDSSQLELKREAIYSLDEDMPKRVKGRLVGVGYRSNK